MRVFPSADISAQGAPNETDRGLQRMPSAAVAAAMRKRAAEVRFMGTYIGMFEWLLWSVAKNVRTNILFGSNLVDVREVFGPTLAIVSLDRP